MTEHRASRAVVFSLKPANYGPQTKYSPPPPSLNKVLLEHSQAHSFTECLWVLSN